MARIAEAAISESKPCGDVPRRRESVVKFRYYIVDPHVEGTVTGTNDETEARDFSQSEKYFVIDSETGKWLGFDGDDQIKKFTS